METGRHMVGSSVQGVLGMLKVKVTYWGGVGTVPPQGNAWFLTSSSA